VAARGSTPRLRVWASTPIGLGVHPLSNCSWCFIGLPLVYYMSANASSWIAGEAITLGFQHPRALPPNTGGNSSWRRLLETIRGPRRQASEDPGPVLLER
ncbi:unnamed protein product, partial [Musa textilis]